MAVSKRVLCASLVLVSIFARAQVAAPPTGRCPAAPETAKTSTATGTSIALEAASKLLAQLGFKIDYRATRDVILADHPQADQMVVVLIMANTLCEMIWSDSALSGAEKASMYVKMMVEIRTPASGPAPLIKTAPAVPPKSSIAPAGLVLAGWNPGIQLAQAEPPYLPTPRTTGFLRDPPFYVNDTNKYFVFVASVADEDAARSVIKKLKAKAPQYDFTLYAPYGSNSYYGIVMASWVPRDVATQALALAKKDVNKDAYIWACRSGGQSC